LVRRVGEKHRDAADRLLFAATSRLDRAMSRPAPITIERLERALAAVSYAIVQDGPIYAPLLERLEREIATLKASDDVVARARRNLARLRDQAAARTLPDDLKLIA
jgi:hypothetical protein